jgi:K+-sensing histidine kinase KdpD
MSAQQGRTGEAPPNTSDRGSLPDAAWRDAEALAAAARRVADRFARLHAATAALSAALTRAEVAGAIAARGAALPGACGCAVALRRPDGTLELAATRGAAELVTGGLLTLPADATFPLARAAEERTPVFFAGGPSAWAALPLESRGELLGAVGVVFEGPLPFDDEERGFLRALAYQCAQALERARLYEAEREARLTAQRLEEAARRAMEREEQLLGIVSHDLRTPLAAIRMSTALLFRGGDLSGDQARTLTRISAAAGRMGRIIRDLLDFTRVRKEGALPLSRRPTDLAHLARRARCASRCPARPTRWPIRTASCR